MVSNIKLTGKHADLAYRFLKEASDILYANQVRFCVDSGTLLGIIREDRLLPWDNDLDFSVFSEDSERIGRAVDDFKSRGFDVQSTTFPRPYGSIKRGDLRICKIKSDEVVLDLIVKHLDGEFYYWMVWDTLKRAPKRFYDKLTTLNFMGKDYPAPSYTHEYLTYRYGEWRITQKKWDMRSDDGAVI